MTHTTHRTTVGDARDLDLPDDSVELVVTSPPYPMIEMWDETFCDLDPAVGAALDDGDGERAFALMHDVLDGVWQEVGRVLAPGGIVCVNVGDATRTLDRFRLYPNHAAVVDRLTERGLSPLPDVLWRKPANGAAKFMGSGTAPPNAYVTLEHEYLLLFRNGERRRPDRERRDRSAYFWEERNRWFSDVWTVRGERQALDDPARDRAAAYPFEIPYRVIQMYSVQGDTVLDPFWGTGTTSLAAMASARHSVGYEREASLVAAFDERVEDLPSVTAARNRERLAAHREFVDERRASGDEPGYVSVVYGFPVVTKQERRLRLPSVERVDRRRAGTTGEYVVDHGTARDPEGAKSASEE